MQLYVGTSKLFVDDAVSCAIGEKLEDEFFRQDRRKASPGETRSWNNGLARMAMVMQRADLLDHGVVLEHQLPLAPKRLDRMVLGRDGSRADQAVVVELKQWSETQRSEADSCLATFVGGDCDPRARQTVSFSLGEPAEIAFGIDGWRFVGIHGLRRRAFAGRAVGSSAVAARLAPLAL